MDVLVSLIYLSLDSFIMQEEPVVVQHLSDVEIRALAERCRRDSPPSAQSGFIPASDRRDPVEMLLEQAELQNRDKDLLPLRHARMCHSAFTFYRGAARIMAHDLVQTPNSGLPPHWICGDAHLCNFGMFSSPERVLIFDLNDFDETSIAPFEWDVKRLAASFIIACRDNEFSSAESRYACLEMLSQYRRAMQEFVNLSHLELFYLQLPVDEALDVMAFRKGDKKSKGKRKKKKKKKKGKKNHQSDDENSSDEEDEKTAYQNAPSGLPWTEKVTKKVTNLYS